MTTDELIALLQKRSANGDGHISPFIEIDGEFHIVTGVNDFGPVRIEWEQEPSVIWS